MWYLSNGGSVGIKIIREWRRISSLVDKDRRNGIRKVSPDEPPVLSHFPGWGGDFSGGHHEIVFLKVVLERPGSLESVNVDKIIENISLQLLPKRYLPLGIPEFQSLT